MAETKRLGDESGGLILLTRDQILQADDRKYELVPVPEWGGTVKVRSLNGSERDGLEAGMLEGRGKNRQVNLQNLRAKLVSLSVVDLEGNLVFSQADIVALGTKNAAALDRVFEVAQRLSGLREEDVDDLVGNSSGDLNGSSTSV